MRAGISADPLNEEQARENRPQAKRPQVTISLPQEVLPIRKPVMVPDEDGRGHRPRRLWLLAQMQSRFVRETIRLAAVDLSVRQHAVLPRSLSTARAWHHMVDIALVPVELSAGVLA